MRFVSVGSTLKGFDLNYCSHTGDPTCEDVNLLSSMSLVVNLSGIRNDDYTYRQAFQRLEGRQAYGGPFFRNLPRPRRRPVQYTLLCPPSNLWAGCWLSARGLLESPHGPPARRLSGTELDTSSAPLVQVQVRWSVLTVQSQEQIFRATYFADFEGSFNNRGRGSGRISGSEGPAD